MLKPFFTASVEISILYLFCLAFASILSAERSINKTRNALFHARSGNGPQDRQTEKNAIKRVTEGDITIKQVRMNRYRVYHVCHHWYLPSRAAKENFQLIL